MLQIEVEHALEQPSPDTNSPVDCLCLARGPATGQARPARPRHGLQRSEHAGLVRIALGVSHVGRTLRPAFFDDTDLTISYIAAGSLLALCVEVTGCGHFGLLLGKREEPSVMGMAGFVLMKPPTSALRCAT